ncbi:hypothetical protein H1R20_g4483, partial [Candolleomyces eurysporus]
MTIAVYTKTKVDSNYLITYVRIYFILSEEVKIRLGSFIVHNLVNDILNAAESAIQCPPSSEELAAAIALLDQKYSAQPSEVLQHLWSLSNAEPLNFIRSAPSTVAILLHQQSPVDLRLAKRKQVTSDPDQPQGGDPNPDQSSGPSTL